MKKLMIAMIGLAAVAGCATRQAAVELEERDDVPGVTRFDVKHVRLKSVLGIDDAVLADTNRFVLGDIDYSQKLKLDKPFGGFTEARVYLDGMDEPGRRTTGGKPHRLRSVELKRRIPGAETEKDLLAEWQAACDFVADALGIESPRVSLVDVGKCRKMMNMFEWGGISSRVTFELADGQYVSVQLKEPTYAMRGGKLEMVIPGSVRIDLMLNQSLCRFSRVRETKGEEKVEKEVCFGPDCTEKLAKALKDEIAKRTQRAKRKPVKEGTKKDVACAVSKVQCNGTAADSRKKADAEREALRNQLLTIQEELKSARLQRTASRNAVPAVAK